jgi:phytoene dehydrogenase-like protein
MPDTWDAIVIGGGANGLTTAAALGQARRRVLLLERGDRPGGQERTVEFAPGFHAAPLGDDSGWVPPVVARGLRLGGLEIVCHEAPVTVAAEPGEFLTLSRHPDRAAEAIRRHSARDAERWPAFAGLLAKLSGFLASLYQLPAPDIDTTSVRDLGSLLGLALKLRGLGRKHMVDLLRVMPMSVQELLDDRFECEPLKAAVAAGGIQDLRQGPRAGGTAFNLLHHLVGAPAGSVRGRGYWRSGPDGFAVLVEQAARAAGVSVRTGAEVSQITVTEAGVTGVVLRSGEELRAPLVCSSADPARTLLGMVDPVWLDPEFVHAVRQIRFRGSTAVVLYALDGLPEVPGLSAAAEVLSGVVSLTGTTEGLERASDAAKYGRVSERPHVEFTIPSIRWPAHAPAGKHVLVARARYAPCQLRNGGPWDPAQRDALTRAVTSAIGTVIPRLTDRVLHRLTLTPADLEERFGLTEGAASHGELALDQILFMRPVAGWARYAMPVSGLYLCGAGGHPGPGILGGPGWLAARQALGDRR